MCRSMADIRSTAAEIRRGKKDRRKKEEGKKLQGKNIMAPLLHRAAIIKVAPFLAHSVQWCIQHVSNTEVTLMFVSDIAIFVLQKGR